MPRASIIKTRGRGPAEYRDRVGELPEATVEVGDEVLVKPAIPRCPSQWRRGVVTKVNSTNNVEVGGMPRPILDLRKVVQPIGDVDREPRGGG